jgi:hypothetical protein
MASISRVANSVSGVAGAYLVAFFVSEAGTKDEWRYVFYTMAILFIISGVLYAVFGSGVCCV